MKFHLWAIAASTALLPAIALAQADPSQPQQSSQAGSAQPRAQSAPDFVKRAAVGNMFEIQSSRLAEQKAQNDQVRQFAQRMVEDHTANMDKLKSTAQGIPGVAIPSELDEQHRQMMQRLQSASGAEFDSTYIPIQVTAHRNAVALFDQYAQNGDNDKLKQFAQQTVPTLRQHLQSVEQIQNALPPAQVGATQNANQQVAQGEGQQDPSHIVVQQPAPTVRVDQGSPQVMVQQPQPQVTVNQAQPEILVRQPQPTVTVDIPQPEIVVRMPQPDVNVAMAQPQVQVRQPQPQVQVVPQEHPQVEVKPGQPKVQVLQQPQQGTDQSRVQFQQSEGQPTVRYERAQPRVVVNQPQGQPQVRVERSGEGQKSAAAQQQGQPQTTDETGATSGESQTQKIEAAQFRGMDLVNVPGQKLGEVEGLVRDADNRLYAVVKSGQARVLLPIDETLFHVNELMVRNLSQDEIRAMPKLANNDNRFQPVDDKFVAIIRIAPGPNGQVQ
jgi:predicted outer membrane protein